MIRRFFQLIFAAILLSLPLLPLHALFKAELNYHLAICVLAAVAIYLVVFTADRRGLSQNALALLLLFALSLFGGTRLFYDEAPVYRDLADPGIGGVSLRSEADLMAFRHVARESYWLQQLGLRPNYTDFYRECLNGHNPQLAVSYQQSRVAQSTFGQALTNTWHAEKDIEAILARCSSVESIEAAYGFNYEQELRDQLKQVQKVLRITTAADFDLADCQQHGLCDNLDDVVQFVIGYRFNVRDYAYYLPYVPQDKSKIKINPMTSAEVTADLIAQLQQGDLRYENACNQLPICYALKERYAVMKNYGDLLKPE